MKTIVRKKRAETPDSINRALFIAGFKFQLKGWKYDTYHFKPKNEDSYIKGYIMKTCVIGTGIECLGCVYPILKITFNLNRVLMGKTCRVRVRFQDLIFPHLEQKENDNH